MCDVCVCAHVRPMPLCTPGGKRQYHWRLRPVVNYRKTLLLWGHKWQAAARRPAVGGAHWVPPRQKEEKVLLIKAYNRLGENEVPKIIEKSRIQKTTL